MTLWIVAALIVAALAVAAVVMGRRARHRIQPTTDDLDAVARAVTEPRPVLTVYRLHTGELDCRHSDLTVSEAITVDERCIQGALNVQYEQGGICEAETYANGETA